MSYINNYKTFKVKEYGLKYLYLLLVTSIAQEIIFIHIKTYKHFTVKRIEVF
jgi:hypothetical protein